MSYPQAPVDKFSTITPGSLPLVGAIETIGAKRPQAADRCNGRAAGPGSCRSRRNETDVDIVPARPDNAPLDDPMLLSECIAELLEMWGF